MKKLYILLFMLPFIAKGQTTYTCVASGDWATSTIWSPNGVPGKLDNVIIGSPYTVTVTAVGGEDCKNLTINSGGVLDNSTSFVVHNGVATVNTGGTWKGTASCGFYGPPNGTFMTGGGTWSNTNNWSFYGAGNGTTETIDASVHITKTNGSIWLQSNGALGSVTVRIVNLGNITLNNGIVSPYPISPTSPATSWIQGTNATLQCKGNGSFPYSIDTLGASATGNTVTFTTGNGNYTIKSPLSTFSNLSIQGPTYIAAFPGVLTVTGNITVGGAVNFANFNLNVGGNFINNGATFSNMNTINFNGSSTQNIEGTSSTTFKNITISGTGNVALQDNTSFTGVLTLSSTGSLNGPAKMTLVSNSGATGMVAQSTGTINATFVIQVYDGRTNPSYQALSTPVQADKLNDWNASNQPSPATPSGYFYMSGIGGVNGNAGNFVSVDKFLEASNTYSPITNFASPGISYNLVQGEGLYIWVANSLNSMSPFTYITNGVPNQGNAMTMSVTHNSSGWNLIGNPFPCPISWSSFHSHNGSLGNTFYIYEESQTWVPFTFGSNIAMEQGFLVTATANTSVSFLESDKTLTATNLLAPGDPTKSDNSVTFTLSEDSNTLSCPTTIIFGGGYSPAYTFNEDNLYIPSIAKKVPVLVTYSSDNKNLIVNRLPDGATQVDVPMSATCNVPAKYTLSTNNIPNLSSYQCVCLIDSKTGAVLNNFSDNSIYTFIATEKGQEFDYIVRFTRLEPGQSCSGNLLTKGNNMQLNSADGSVLQANSPDGNYTIIPTQNGAAINFNFPQAEDVIVSAYNMLGQKVINDIHTNVSSSQLNIALPQTTGIYTIRVETPNGVTVKKLYR